MLLVFKIRSFFNSCDITDCIYRGWVGGRGWGWYWRLVESGKATVQTQTAVLRHQLTQGRPSLEFGTPCSPLMGHTAMKYTPMIWQHQKSQLSNACCLWMMHEYIVTFIHRKMDFSICDIMVSFSKFTISHKFKPLTTTLSTRGWKCLSRKRTDDTVICLIIRTDDQASKVIELSQK